MRIRLVFRIEVHQRAGATWYVNAWRIYSWRDLPETYSIAHTRAYAVVSGHSDKVDRLAPNQTSRPEGLPITARPLQEGRAETDAHACPGKRAGLVSRLSSLTVLERRRIKFRADRFASDHPRELKLARHHHFRKFPGKHANEVLQHERTAEKKQRDCLKTDRDGARSAAGRMTAVSRARNVREPRFQMRHYRDCAGDPLMS